MLISVSFLGYDLYVQHKTSEICEVVSDKKFKRIAKEFFDVELESGKIIVLPLKEAPNVEIGKQYCYKTLE